MAGRTKIHSVDEVRRWYEDGLTYKEMSELHLQKYGVLVTTSGFSALRRRMGWPSRQAGDSPLMPWKVESKHASAYLYTMLRREIRRREGLPWSSTDPEEKLDQWVDGLRESGAVIDYRPETEAGFFLTYARPGVDTDLIREPLVS